MRGKGSFRQSLFILLALSLWNISLADNNEEKPMNAEETKVLKAVTTMTEAFHQKNIKGVLTSYEKGAAIMFEPGEAISDPELIQQMFEGAFQINPDYSYPKGHEVYIANDIALHIAPWEMKGKSPTGANLSASGLSVAVLRKQANGTWLMVLDNPHGQALLGL